MTTGAKSWLVAIVVTVAHGCAMTCLDRIHAAQVTLTAVADTVQGVVDEDHSEELKRATRNINAILSFAADQCPDEPNE